MTTETTGAREYRAAIGDDEGRRSRSNSDEAVCMPTRLSTALSHVVFYKLASFARSTLMFDVTTRDQFPAFSDYPSGGSTVAMKPFTVACCELKRRNEYAKI